jgi:double-GTPase-like protein
MTSRNRQNRKSAMTGVRGRNAKEAVASMFRLRPEDSMIDVTMIGSTGTGKTTLLASMYERFNHVIGNINLDVHALDHGDAARLNSYVENLHRLPDSIKVTGGIPGTGRPREYVFGVGPRGRRSAFNLRFTDYPGKFVLDPNTEGSERLSGILGRSQVILVAIDTPALVEKDGRYHEAVNRTMTVFDEVKRLLRETQEPRLIILTLLKCERYLGSKEQARMLAKRAIEAYQPLLDYMGNGEVAARTGCVLAPVQTVGSVVLSKVEEDENRLPVFYFRNTKIGAAYAPLDTDQPLRYTLRFVINSYRSDQRPLLKAIWEQAIGVDTQLIAAVDEFANGCKNTDGFAVLQDHPYLHGGAAWAGAR